MAYKCKQCADTGLLVPLDDIPLETLLEIEKMDCVMECDSCETASDFDAERKYLKQLIERAQVREKSE